MSEEREERGTCYLCEKEGVIVEYSKVLGPDLGQLCECPECGELTCFSCWDASGVCQLCAED